MKDKRVYVVNRMDMVDFGEPLGIVYRPWLGGLDHFDDDNEDYWEVVYSQAHVDGVHEMAIVGVYTDEVNHEVLADDPDIARVDDLTNLQQAKTRFARVGLGSVKSIKEAIKTINPLFDDGLINYLKTKGQ